MSIFQSVEKVLADRQSPIKVFFRNDDGGWADKRLQQLTKEFIQQELPLDIAVIPDVLSEQSADCLLYTSPSPRDKRQSRMPSSA